MRYTIDSEGYLISVNFGCTTGTCSEYTGTIPDGYETIEEWYEDNCECVKSWKIVDGSLVFDLSKDYKTKILYEQEAEENKYVTRKELGIKNTDEVNPYANIFPDKEATSWGYISHSIEETIETGNIPTQRIELSLHEDQNLDLIELEFIGNNFLPNTATNTSNNGIAYTLNIDKTINIIGTSTDKSTLNLAGTDTSLKHILTFKKGYNYYDSEDNLCYMPYSYILSGLVDGMSLEFYNYDGTNRTLVGIYKNNEVISFDKDMNVTQIILTIDNGVVTNTTIKPMLHLANLEHPILPMTKNKSNLFNINSTNKYIVSGTNHIINGNSINISGTWYVGFLIDVEEYTDYTLSFERTINVSATNTGFWNIYDASISTRIYAGGSTTKGTFNTGNNTQIYVLLYCGAGADNQGDVTFSNIQLEKGVVATSYRDYDGRDGQYYVDGVSVQNGTPTPDTPIEITNLYAAGTYNAIIDNKIYTFTLPEDLRSVPNGVADRLWFDIDSGLSIERKVGTITYNGSESTWALTEVNETSALFYNPLATTKPFSSSISDYFLYNSGIYNASVTDIGFYISNNQRVFIRAPFTNLTDFKTWLSTHNTEVLYELATYTTSNIPSYSYSTYEYEEYKNNTTLIDLNGNDFTDSDKIVIEDNQIMLVKNRDELKTIFLGDVPMPRVYTPYTNAYCHQRVAIDFIYKDPRNIDITKLDLKNIEIIADIRTRCDFTNDDLLKVYQYVNNEIELTEEEIGIYDTNGDGKVTYLDYVNINNLIKNNEQYIIQGTLEINSSENKRSIVLKDSEKNARTSIGLDGITAPSISVNDVSIEEKITPVETSTCTLLNGKRVYKKLFTGTMPSTTNTSANLINYDLDCTQVWIDESMSFIYNDEETLGINWWNSTTDYMRTAINKTSNVVKYKSGSNLSSFTYNIVLAYTKE